MQDNLVPRVLTAYMFIFEINIRKADARDLVWLDV